MTEAAKETLRLIITGNAQGYKQALTEAAGSLRGFKAESDKTHKETAQTATQAQEKIKAAVEGTSKAAKESAQVNEAANKKIADSAKDTAATYVDAAGKKRDASGKFVKAHKEGTDQIVSANEKAKASVRDASATFGLMFAGLAAGIAKVSGDFAQYEAVLNKFQSVSNATTAELEQFKQVATEYGKATQFSNKAIAEAGFEMSKLGLTTQQTISALPGIVNAAAAAGINLAQAGEIIVGVLNGFQKEAGESAKVADILAQAANKSAVDFADLGESFKYIGPIAKASGQSLEDMAAVVSILGNNMIVGGQAGTALRAGLVRLQAPADDAKKALNALGVDITDADGKMRRLPEIMKDMQKAFVGVEESTKNAALATIFGQEALSGFAALLNTTPEAMDEMIKSMNEAEGQSKAMRDVMEQGLADAVTKFKGSMEVASTAMGESFAPALEKIVRWLQSAVDGFTAIPKPVKDTMAEMSLLTVGLLGAGGVIFAVGKTVSIIKELGKALVELKLITAASAGPIGIGIAGAVAVTGAYLYSKNVTEDADEKEAKRIEEVTARNNELKKSYDKVAGAIQDKNKEVKISSKDVGEAIVYLERTGQKANTLFKTLKDMQRGLLHQEKTTPKKKELTEEEKKEAAEKQAALEKALAAKQAADEKEIDNFFKAQERKRSAYATALDNEYAKKKQTSEKIMAEDDKTVSRLIDNARTVETKTKKCMEGVWKTMEATFGKQSEFVRAGLQGQLAYAYQGAKVLAQDEMFERVKIDPKKDIKSQLRKGDVAVYQRGVMGFSQKAGHIEVMDPEKGLAHFGKSRQMRFDPNAFAPGGGAEVFRLKQQINKATADGNIEQEKNNKLIARLNEDLQKAVAFQKKFPQGSAEWLKAEEKIANLKNDITNLDTKNAENEIKLAKQVEAERKKIEEERLKIDAGIAKRQAEMKTREAKLTGDIFDDIQTEREKALQDSEEAEKNLLHDFKGTEAQRVTIVEQARRDRELINQEYDKRQYDAELALQERLVDMEMDLERQRIGLQRDSLSKTLDLIELEAKQRREMIGRRIEDEKTTADERKLLEQQLTQLTLEEANAREKALEASIQRQLDLESGRIKASMGRSEAGRGLLDIVTGGEQLFDIDKEQDQIQNLEALLTNTQKRILEIDEAMSKTGITQEDLIQKQEEKNKLLTDEENLMDTILTLLDPQFQQAVKLDEAWAKQKESLQAILTTVGLITQGVTGLLSKTGQAGQTLGGVIGSAVSLATNASTAFENFKDGDIVGGVLGAIDAIEDGIDLIGSVFDPEADKKRAEELLAMREQTNTRLLEIDVQQFKNRKAMTETEAQELLVLEKQLEDRRLQEKIKASEDQVKAQIDAINPLFRWLGLANDEIARIEQAGNQEREVLAKEHGENILNIERAARERRFDEEYRQIEEHRQAMEEHQKRFEERAQMRSEAKRERDADIQKSIAFGHDLKTMRRKLAIDAMDEGPGKLQAQAQLDLEQEGLALLGKFEGQHGSMDGWSEGVAKAFSDTLEKMTAAANKKLGKSLDDFYIKAEEKEEKNRKEILKHTLDQLKALRDARQRQFEEESKEYENRIKQAEKEIRLIEKKLETEKERLDLLRKEREDALKQFDAEDKGIFAQKLSQTSTMPTMLAGLGEIANPTNIPLANVSDITQKRAIEEQLDLLTTQNENKRRLEEISEKDFLSNQEQLLLIRAKFLQSQMQQEGLKTKEKLELEKQFADTYVEFQKIQREAITERYTAQEQEIEAQIAALDRERETQRRTIDAQKLKIEELRIKAEADYKIVDAAIAKVENTAKGFNITMNQLANEGVQNLVNKIMEGSKQLLEFEKNMKSVQDLSSGATKSETAKLPWAQASAAELGMSYDDWWAEYGMASGGTLPKTGRKGDVIPLMARSEEKFIPPEDWKSHWVFPRTDFNRILTAIQPPTNNNVTNAPVNYITVTGNSFTENVQVRDAVLQALDEYSQRGSYKFRNYG